MPVLTSTQIVIATTEEPSAVLRLKRLRESIGRATICLANTNSPVGISNFYSDFVREPTGAIERCHGHRAWRMDVSTALSTGHSWQLGAFLAHALEAQGALHMALTSEEGAQRTVWATGTVDALDLRVGPVGHVESKARKALKVEPPPDLFLIPEDNAGNVPSSLRDELNQRGTKLEAVRTMSEAFELLGLPSSWLVAATAVADGAWAGKPFRGLEPYEAEHRPIFFGRSRAREEAVERLRRMAAQGRPLIVVHGSSGVGKSSLAMAGLSLDVSELATEATPFSVSTLRFGSQQTPQQALWTALDKAGGSLNEIHEEQSTEQRLKALLAQTDRKTILLVLDQLEQALLASPEEVEEFGKVLTDLIRTGKVWVIATLRSDRLDLLEKAPDLVALAEGEALYRLAPPTLSELGQMIQGPLSRAGLRFETADEENLSDHLAQEALKAPDSLPLLQITLMRLAEQASEDGAMDMAAYERIGGFQGAVGRWADETLRELEGQNISTSTINQALAALVRIDPDSGRADARVIDPSKQPEKVQDVHAAFIEARLATTNDTDGTRSMRLAHDTLIHDWPRFERLVGELRGEIALRDRLEDEAAKWVNDGEPVEDLVGNLVRLEAAEALQTSGLVTLSEEAERFIEASRRETTRVESEQEHAALKERRNRTRLSIAMGLLVLVGVGAWALLERQAAKAQAQISIEQARRADVQETLLRAERLRTEEAEQATALAHELTLQAESAAKRAEESRLEAEAERVVAEENLDQALRSSFLFISRELRTSISKDVDTVRAVLQQALPEVDKLHSWGLVEEGHRLLQDIEINDKELLRLDETAINYADFSPDGTQIITASGNGVAGIWDAYTGERLQTLSSGNGTVEVAKFSPNGKVIITGSADGTAQTWNVSSGEPLRTLIGHDWSVATADFSPDSTMVVTSPTLTGPARVWDVESGSEVAKIGSTDDHIEDAKFSPNGESILVSFLDGIEQWDLRPLSKVFRIDRAGVVSADYSPDGQRIIVALENGTAEILDADSGDVLIVLRGHTRELSFASYSVDGQRLVTASWDGTARLWDAKSGESLEIFQGNSGAFMSALFSPDGSRIVTAGPNVTTRVWSTRKAGLVQKLRGSLEFSSSNLLSALALSPDGQRLVSVSRDGDSFLWDVSLGRVISPPEGYSSKINDAGFSSNGLRIVTGSDDGKIHIWNTVSGQQEAEFASADGVASILISPDGNWIASKPFGGSVKLWNVEEDTSLDVFYIEHDENPDLSFSPDGKKLAIMPGYGGLQVWDVMSGELILEIDDHASNPGEEVFSPDSERIFTRSWQADSIQIWDIKRREVTATVNTGDQETVYASFLKGPMQLVTMADDGSIKFWDAISGEYLRDLETYDSVDTQALVLVDETRALLVNKNGRASVVQLGDGSVYGYLEDFPQNPEFLVFSKDGEVIAATSKDGTVLVWNIHSLSSLEALIARAKFSAFTPMSIEERERFYLPYIKEGPSREDIHVCDWRAANPYDPDLVLSGGVLFASLDAEAALEACNEGIAQQPGNMRFQYQKGRALARLERRDEARTYYQTAWDGGYRMGGYAIANEMMRAPEKESRLEARTLMADLAADGMAVARFTLGWMDWDGVAATSEDRNAALAQWQQAAKAGSAHAHRQLSRLLIGNESLINPNAGQALFHAAIATQLFEDAGDWSAAKEMRLRRANLARNLSDDILIGVWDKVEIWEPSRQ